ncbi:MULTISPECIES: DUF4123 domain-containing protein [unclassified Halomonas]|uniref:DUF4123 domain-containing protein n=1 Tax=unclassified Halomonas TaxID=2609666 RepID=UPI0007F05484|nr:MULTISPECIES: DUF4123 domain-containing protein [unclassified Halomonas]SBR49379.1 protein of unknown function (DUF4123) [Halomonas sp. HL-93]SNY96348.1 protein of unknown function [Halomonas sp. hl-4]
MEHVREATHALIDGVRYPEAFKRLYSRDDLDEIEPVYLTTRWASLAEQGPILVRLRGTSLANEASVCGEEALYRSLSLLSSSASTASLGEHLRQCVTFKGEGGQEKLLRFADPLVTRHWLASYEKAPLRALMGPIDRWWVADWAPNWEASRPLKWQSFRADASLEVPEAEQTPDLPPFGRHQFTALDAVVRWQLKERLTNYLSEHAITAWEHLPINERGQWLDDRLDDAIAWGVSTERQVAIWVELSLNWGEDYMTASDGLYADWARHSPNDARLSRQDQLYALDAWSRTPAANAPQSAQSHASLSQEPLFIDEEADG